ncbi:hypothetical protein XI06_21570 [Bradyrhizobium sp. CCBAU 11434]|nr:hypothetical protein [Bradyrhizobium sp. CCBAU 11434]
MQVCSAANTAALACAFSSVGRFDAIASAGARVAHAGTAMLGLQMHQRAARTLSLVRDGGALAGVRQILIRAARASDPPQASTYPMTMDAQIWVACQQALACRLRLFDFTPKRQPLGSAESHGQA